MQLDGKGVCSVQKQSIGYVEFMIENDRFTRGIGRSNIKVAIQGTIFVINRWWVGIPAGAEKARVVASNHRISDKNADYHNLGDYPRSVEVTRVELELSAR